MAKDLRDMSDMVGDLHWMAAKAIEDLVKKEGEIAKRDARIVELEARIVWLECESQVSAAPVPEAKAQGVVMPPSPYMPGSQPTDFTDYELGEIHGRIAMWEEVKRLNAAPAQQVSAPETYGLPPLPWSLRKCNHIYEDYPEVLGGKPGFKPVYLEPVGLCIGQTHLDWPLADFILACVNAAPVQQVSVPVACSCGREYPANSYSAGFISGSGMCEVCDAAMPPKDIPQQVSVPDERIIPTSAELIQWAWEEEPEETRFQEGYNAAKRWVKMQIEAGIAAPVAPAADAGLVEALEGLLGCPWNVEDATVPRAGIDAAPPYQVVGTMHVSLTRLRMARAALAAHRSTGVV